MAARTSEGANQVTYKYVSLVNLDSMSGEATKRFDDKYLKKNKSKSKHWLQSVDKTIAQWHQQNMKISINIGAAYKVVVSF
jgi:poly-beta-hydroxyalkanoate depolymerase